VVGRALRRQNYELNEQSLFNPEYADIFGVPFNFAASGVIAPPQPPKKLTLVKAMSPERDKLEISFPCVSGYRAELPKEEISASFNENSRYELTPDEVGPTRIHAAALIGERQNFDLEHLKDERQSKIVYHLTQHLMLTTLAEPDTPPKLHLFGPLKKVVTEWVENYLICKGDTCPALLLYKCLADKACQRIKDAIVRAEHERAKKLGIPTIKAILNPFHASGTSLSVNFPTTKETLWATEPHRCHVNYVVYDSNWESLFCQVLESHQKVVAYVKNHRLGFEVPYQIGNVAHLYYPDFIVRVDDGHGADDLLNLVVEIKGFRGEDAQIKADTMQTYWIPGVNYLKTFGRWAFLELREPFMMEYELNKFLDYFDKELQTVLEKG
jgi:type III restriction enzyme